MKKIFSIDFPTINTDEELQSLVASYPKLDPAYINTSTSPFLARQKTLIERMWEQFCPYADNDFSRKISVNGEFLSRCWEMTIGCALDNGVSHHFVA
jgi:hypothetical protein